MIRICNNLPSCNACIWIADNFSGCKTLSQMSKSLNKSGFLPMGSEFWILCCIRIQLAHTNDSVLWQNGFAPNPAYIVYEKQELDKNMSASSKGPQENSTWLLSDHSQCPKTDLNKKYLPRPKTTTAWKLILHRSKISKNWNLPLWVPPHRFFKNWFLLIQQQLYSNYIQTHFTQ